MGFQDDNRYNAGRGAHLYLKRAEKARALVSKIPGINLGSLVFDPSYDRYRGEYK